MQGDTDMGSNTAGCICFGSMVKLMVLTLFLYYSVFGQSPIASLVMPAKIRDFKESNTPGGHPDFQNYGWTTPSSPNAVYPSIDVTGSKSTFPLDNRNPKLRGPGKHFSGATNFDDWYNDRDSTINRPFLIGLTFNVYENCLFVYSNTAFFPIDDGGDFYSTTVPPQATFGHLQSKYLQHNFSFTMEFHTTFTYVKGADQVFTFNGDDDVWVYINDSLVIDLGGLHPPRRESVNLDQLKPGFLRDGNKYTLDFFSAERHTGSSQIQITTSILFDNGPGVGILTKTSAAKGKLVRCYGEWVEMPPLTNIGKLASAMTETEASGILLQNHAGANRKNSAETWNPHMKWSGSQLHLDWSDAQSSIQAKLETGKTNPSSFNTQNFSQLALVNTQGQKKRSVRLKGQSANLDFSDFESGVYRLMALNPQGAIIGSQRITWLVSQ